MTGTNVNGAMPDDSFFGSKPARTPGAAPTDPWAARVAPCELGWFTKPPPAREWLLRDSRAKDAGVLPLGKVGLVSGPGGASKTMLLVMLALAVSSHEPTAWLGCYTVPDQGRVLLLLGEEEADEVQRRLYNARRALDAPIPEPGSIVVVALAGITCPMIESDERGNPIDGPFLLWVRTFVKSHGPFRLVVVDPLSRFAGKDAEIDNAMATRFVQACESIATESKATVMVAHHTNKTAPASAGRQAVRGSSAIFDGVRWAAALDTEKVDTSDAAFADRLGELATLSIVKSNYSRKSDPVTMRRDNENGGALVPLSKDERELIANARAEAAPPARRQEQRAEAGKRATGAVAEAVRAVLAATPGMSGRALLAAVVARRGHCSRPSLEAALASLGAEVRTEPGPNRTDRHYLAEVNS